MGSSDEGAPEVVELSRRTTHKRPRNNSGMDLSPGAAGHGAHAGTATAPKTKRARRRLSCLSCQKLKCRCEYDAAAHACVRCRNLRIFCSLSDSEQQVSSPSLTGKEPANVEERLNQQDQTIAALQVDIRQLLMRLDALAPQTHPLQPTNALSVAADASEELEELSVPADIDVPSAPTVIVRDLSLRLSGGFRRTLQNVGPNLIELGLLDEATAETLYHSAVEYPSIRSDGLGIHAADTLQTSPFLHAACCLLGIYLGNHECRGTRLHRQIYEHVRIALGQVLLASPLPLNEIHAVILLNTYSPLPVKVGTEYIDSWLISGSCAQQAMLSISFSSIVKNIKAGTSTESDHRALRLWVRVCLQHLQWGATTGRPSMIPAQYMDQCNILLSVFEATIQDGMLVAEVLLYRTLHALLLADQPNKSQGGQGGRIRDEEFQSWKAKWEHLFALPRSSELKIAYYTVRLIRAIRSTEDGEHRIMETYSSAVSAVVSVSGSRQQSGGRAQDYTPPPSSRDVSLDRMQAHSPDATSDRSARKFQEYILMLSIQMIETLLQIVQPQPFQIPDYMYMCAAYAALIIGHRGHLMKGDRPMELLTAMYHLHCTGPVLSVAVHLALTTLQATLSQDPRAGATRRVAPGGARNGAVPLAARSTLRSRSPSDQLHGMAVSAEHTPAGGVLETSPAPQQRVVRTPGQDTLPEHEKDTPICDMHHANGVGLPEDIFPTLEGFFTGGFLDLVS